MSTRDHIATYSPDDDKIRIYPAYRLSADQYAEVKAAGYGWAPKSECFYAVWSPNREETALNFAAEIEDEDKSLIDRAEDRADRFADYSEKRANDADRAREQVNTLTEHIPMGQPILVGHHSEKHARRQAKQIEAAMTRAVSAWETSEYWTRRAAAAISHAKYKERPDVRARRIKTIEADKRKQERNQTDAQKWLDRYNAPDILTATLKDGRQLFAALIACGYDSGLSYEATRQFEKGELLPADALTAATTAKARIIQNAARWIVHYNNRLAYEKAMLQTTGAGDADRWNFEQGGQIQARGVWFLIVRINRVAGQIRSFTTGRRSVLADEVTDYKPPTAEESAAVKTALAKAPICNYPSDAIILVNRYYPREIADPLPTMEMTAAEWKRRHKDYKGTNDVRATAEHAAHRVRIAQKAGSFRYHPVFITDEKRKDPPPLTAAPVKPAMPTITQAPQPAAAPAPRPEPTEQAAAMRSMKETLKTGVKTVTAPQLFPTPPEIAERMIELADIQPGQVILEPSAGTGNILKALPCVRPGGIVIAVEINQQLADAITRSGDADAVHCQDFLQYHPGPYHNRPNRIVMNPPFINGEDIKHIKHALTVIKPGGLIVALCAAGPKQQAALKPLADHWEILPAGTFQGTNVTSILLTIQHDGQLELLP